jgi:hypothetical protein
VVVWTVVAERLPPSFRLLERSHVICCWVGAKGCSLVQVGCGVVESLFGERNMGSLMVNIEERE